ncbi:GNAT family N-acetyltransferase [Streptomyces albicerus]|uniref:GNAT family N-acetyltransferase n=1 Tax=Streptomyces albicerus TaxID=2569859 RepID=UPI00124BB253|nr:GNAT family N-acetyltransferase [Streptomyces albicerus]
MTDLVIRHLAEDESHLFESMPASPLVGFAAFGDSFGDMAAQGEYRPEWIWVALRDGKVVARAAWWGGPGDSRPATLDWFDFTDAQAATELLRTAPLRAQYMLKLPPDWRENPAVRAEADARVAAASAAGLTPQGERNHYRWTPGCGLPQRPGRLRFLPEPDDAVILDVFRRIHRGSLDSQVRRTVEASGIDVAAQEQLDYLLWMPSPRSWWRLAHTPDGELAGLVAPCRNYTAPLIGYVGVVPEQRGHNYAYDLLAEATHFLAAEGADCVTAGTDRANTPMVGAFLRAGYPVAQRRIDLI